MPDRPKSSLEERLEFLEIDADARAALASVQPIIDAVIGPALDRFYKKVSATPEMARFFRDRDHMAAAKGRQAKHWQIITGGAFGEDYTKGVTAVGQTHARIGLEPRWYIGGYALVLEKLLEGILVGREEAFRKKRVTTNEIAQEIAAVVKSALLDMDYAITVYLDALEVERKKAEEAEQEATPPPRSRAGKSG